MLPAARRIRRADEFRSVLRGPARAATPTLVVHAAGLASSPPHDPRTPGGARAGFIVGRAVGGSVVRNRVRRRLRHLMLARLGELPDGVAVVVRALPAAAGAPSATLEADLSRALARAQRTLGHQPVTTDRVTQ